MNIIERIVGVLQILLAVVGALLVLIGLGNATYNDRGLFYQFSWHMIAVGSVLLIVDSIWLAKII